MSFRAQSPEVEGLLAPVAQQALDVVSDAPSFFEDVADQGPLQSIEHFCRSHQSYQRLAYSQGIAAAAAAASAEYEDCVELLLPLVQQLAKDSEVEIRSTAVKQLPGVGSALYAKDAERSMRDIEGVLLVCAQQCALDDEDEVSHAAILSFQQLVQLLPSARATAASKRAVDRLESQGSDDGTLAAVRLLAHTVASWTPEALRRHVPRYVGRWTSHREFAVREAVATCMSLVVQPMPLRLCHQVMLPAFYQLSRDQNWRVRRACSLDLPRLAEALHKRPADSSCSSSMSSTVMSSSSSSSSGHNWQQEVEADQPLGYCSSRPSSCLSTLQRFGTEVGGVNTNLLAASLAAAAGPQRNRSYPSLIAHRSPASTAEIMTKHPMHSSLITDGLLSGSSSCASMPGSPSAGSDVASLAHDSHDDACTPLDQLHQHHNHAHAAMSDTEQEQQHRSHHHASRSHQHQQEQQQPQCKLEAQAGLLHDCWCALRQCMELLTADSSHWVKVAALSGLGPFLLQLPHCQLGQLLLGRFTSMAGSTVVIYEVSVALACAQAFGQLTVLLGPDRWPDMRDAWHALQSSRDPAVLCEVVSCLPQLMAALGPVLTQQEMVPALAGLLQSHMGWIGGQLVQVMADLLAHLPPSGHELLLKTLPQLATSTGDRTRSWRMRRDLALQLGRLAAVAGPEAIENSLWPTAMSLCCDPVAAVRTAAARQVGPILAALPSHMLHFEHEAAAGLDNCSPCSAQRLSSGNALCQPRSRLSLLGSSSAAAAAAATPSAADAGSADDSSRADSHNHASSTASADDTAGEPAVGLVRTGSGGMRGVRSSSSKDRSSSSLSVRFALDDSCPGADSSISSSSDSGAGHSTTANRHGSSRLAGFVGPAAAADGRSSGARSGSSCSSSMEFDELELPSALAPAPAGCFSNPSDSDNDSDADDAACGADSSDSSSGLSSSSSRSSDEGSNHRGIGGSSSSDDESGNGSSSDSDDGDDTAGSSGGQQRWRGVLDPSQQQVANGPEHLPCSNSSGNGLDGTAESAAQPDTSSSGSDLHGAAAALQRPQHAMHPAMMPVGALSAAAAAAAAQGSVPRPVPASKRLASSSRGSKSTGDLARLQHGAHVSSSQPEDSTHRRLGDSVVGCFMQQQGRRQLADSLPNSLLAAADGSSDDDCSRHSSNGPWSGGLPQPAHAAPHQYLPVLVEYFGCSSRHQQRQLFVPLAMGLLASCHRVLSCAQQAVLLDRLEALAHDGVPGVRYAVAAALADVREAAAAVSQSGTQQPQQQQQQQEQEPQQEQSQVAGEGSADAYVRAADNPDMSGDLQQQQRQQQQAAANAGPAQAAVDAPTTLTDTADEAAQRTQVQPSPVSRQQQQPHKQQPGPTEAEQQQQQQEAHRSPEQPASEPQPQQEPTQVQTHMVGHVPKGAHPLLGYQAYVQQLATVAGVKSAAASPPAATTSSSNSGGSSANGTSANSTSSSGTSSKRVSWGSLSVVNIAPVANGSRASPVSHSRHSLNGAASSRQQHGQEKHAAPADVPSCAPKQRPSGAASAAATAPTGTAAAAQPGAAAAGGGDDAARGGDGEAAEWLRKLSTCQQLERLLHVVALTTGPL